MTFIFPRFLPQPAALCLAQSSSSSTPAWTSSACLLYLLKIIPSTFPSVRFQWHCACPFPHLPWMLIKKAFPQLNWVVTLFKRPRWPERECYTRKEIIIWGSWPRFSKPFMQTCVPNDWAIAVTSSLLWILCHSWYRYNVTSGDCPIVWLAILKYSHS